MPGADRRTGCRRTGRLRTGRRRRRQAWRKPQTGRAPIWTSSSSCSPLSQSWPPRPGSSSTVRIPNRRRVTRTTSPRRGRNGSTTGSTDRPGPTPNRWIPTGSVATIARPRPDRPCGAMGRSERMDFVDVVARRRTTNGPLSAEPVRLEHQQMLVDAAGMAPSHFNSQPWRFVLIDDRDTIDTVADVSAESMREVFEAGRFFTRYRKYFRFSEEEMDATRDGILFDQLPKALAPFRKFVFTDTATTLMNKLRVPKTLAASNRELVAGAPLVLAALLDRSENRPGELSSFYSTFCLGAAMENVWLTTTELGMG